MAYKKVAERRQRILFPDCIDEYVEEDAPVRLFNAFVDSLNMKELGFIRSTPNVMGAPGYNPSDLLKLYIYGYFYQVRSSRKLARECKCNVEVMWLICKLTPDFRKDNHKAIAQILKEFNKFCMGLKLFSKSYISIDGSKFKAVNAKDRNFTLNKLDDRIKRLDEHITLYMAELDACDQEEGRKLSKDEIQHKLDVCKERKERYEGYRSSLEESGESQISLTDKDAKLMKANEGFVVGYNTQTAVDAESHMIASYKVTNNPIDHGQLSSVASEVKADYGVEVLETTADKGYEDSYDHANALAEGIIPNVIQRNGGCTETIEFSYKEQDISADKRASSEPADLRSCLEAGIIPDAYKDILSDAEIVEIKKRAVAVSDSAVLNMTPDEMLAKAREGFFVRDAERNLVYCPQGCILRQKSIKSNGNIRYCNKLACKRCTNKCTISKFKEADFSKDTLIKPVNGRSKQNSQDDDESTKEPRQTIVRKVVKYILHLDQKKTDNRKCLSEHPFGTIKRSLGHYYFLLKGFAKVSAEMGLFCLSYNLRRAISLRGVPALLAEL